MSGSDVGPFTMFEVEQPPRVGWRRLPALLGQAIQLVWAAAAGEFLLATILRAIGSLGLALPILAGRDMLAALVETEETRDLSRVLVFGIMVLGLLGVLNVVSAVAAARDELLRELIERHAQRRILDVAHAVELEHYETPAFHNRLERASMSARIRPQQLVGGLAALTEALLGVIGVSLALAVFEPLLVPLTLAAGVPLLIAGTRMGAAFFALIVRLTPAERERSYLLHLLTRRTPAKEIRAFGLAGYLRRRWDRRTDERLDELREMTRERLRIMLLARLASGAVLAAVLGSVVALAVSGRMTIAEAGAAGSAILLLGSRLRTAGMGTDQLFEAAPFVQDLTAFLNFAREAEKTPSAPAPKGFERLTVDDVTFTYPSGDRPALQGISVEIHKGEVIALVGENGSGKTTLAKLLCRLYRPQSGRILWDGVDTAQVDPDQLRSSVAILFQDFVQYLLSAADNIAAGRWPHADDRQRTIEAAERAGADKFLAALPHGYDTLLGPEFAEGTDLSIGQWQRVALARAFFRDAPFVILDEPTAALDAQAEHELFQRLRGLLAGRTVLLISHRFSTVRSADRIYVLADGRLVEQGTHKELMSVDGRYAELFRLQASSYLDAASQRGSPSPFTDVLSARDGE